jgi:hypothetical protein
VHALNTELARTSLSLSLCVHLHLSPIAGHT